MYCFEIVLMPFPEQFTLCPRKNILYNNLPIRVKYIMHRCSFKYPQLDIWSLLSWIHMLDGTGNKLILFEIILYLFSHQNIALTNSGSKLSSVVYWRYWNGTTNNNWIMLRWVWFTLSKYWLAGHRAYLLGPLWQCSAQLLTNSAYFRSTMKHWH